MAGHTHLYRRGAVYYFYRRIPAAVFPLFREEHATGFVKVSLRTKDRAEAVRRLHLEAVKWDEAFARRAAQGEAADLSEFEVERFARLWVAERLADDEERRAEGLDEREYAKLAETLDVVEAGVGYALARGDTWVVEAEIAEWLASKGVTLVRGSPGYRRAMLRFLKADREVIAKRKARHAGLIVETPKADVLASVAPFPLMVLYDAYVAAVQPARATVPQFRSIVAKLVEWLASEGRSDDAREVTKADLERWRDHLRQLKIGPKRIKEGYLAAVRAVYGWAVKEGRLSENPARDVFVPIPRTSEGRERDLTDAEALAILRAATGVVLKPSGNKASATRAGGPVMASTIRWVPWLMAYTGARVAEVTQLRKCDIIEDRGVSAIRITPDAGSTKTRKARKVPLHPHLIEQGFLEFVAARPDGPLFFDEGGSDMPAKRAERLAAWVRELGVTDVPQPNHGWRHRFKSEARRVNMPADVRDYLQGHAPRSEGEAYGHMPIEVLAEWVAKLPRYEAG